MSQYYTTNKPEVTYNLTRVLWYGIFPTMKSLLPIIFVILALTGVATYILAKKIVPQKEVSRIGISANQLDGVSVPRFSFNSTSTPTPTAPKAKVTATPTPTATPSITVTPTVTPATKKADLADTNEKTVTTSTTKGGQTGSITKTITKTTVCTPVYGMAATCTEHIVVDTGAADSIFFNLAGLSYIGGLVAFVKAKSIKK